MIGKRWGGTEFSSMIEWNGDKGEVHSRVGVGVSLLYGTALVVYFST